MRHGVSLLAFMLLMLSSSVMSAREKRRPNSLYCTQAKDGTWLAQSFQPLINAHSKMTFAQIEFAAKRVDEVRLRRFFPGYDVEFDYKFDSNGKLNSMVGSVAVSREWVGESSLYPNEDGTVSNIQVKFYKPGTEERIVRPEDAERYTAELSKVPIYRTVESLPCAGSFEVAEKMNATQK
jgi:hypothetical protein